MSSEVCPFCGKSFKRLKSHLPHCKAAPSSETPQSKQDAAASKTTSSSQLDPHLSKAAAKGKKSALTSSATAGLQTESVSPSLTPSPPPSTKRRKQKLADQIRTAASVTPPAISKPKKKSLRALIEAAKSNQDREEPHDGAASGDPPAFSPLTSRTATQTDNTTKDAKFDQAPKEKVSKSKRNEVSPATKQTSESLDSKQSDIRPRARANFWVDSEGETEDLSVNDLFFKPGDSQGKITLQDVKATLGRASGARQSFKSPVETPVGLSGRTRAETGLSAATPPSGKPDVAVSGLVKTAALSVQLPGAGLRHTEPQSAANNAPKSQQPSLILPHNEATPLPPARAPSQTTSPGRTAGHRVAGLLGGSPPLSRFSSPLYFPVTPQAPQLEVKKQNTADSPTEAVLARRPLGQVTLRELPEWLAVKTPSHPRDVVQMVQRGWRWYYSRYIDVKKGGVAGLGMLLAGYCVLSYVWTYPHTKLDRWRKYH